MPLDKPGMEKKLVDLIDNAMLTPPDAGNPPNPVLELQQYTAVAALWADAYKIYIRKVASCAGKANSAILAVQEKLVVSSMAAALQTSLDPATASAAIAAALTLFWVNPLVITPIAPALPAVIVPVGFTVAVQTGLLASMTTNAATIAGTVPPVLYGEVPTDLAVSQLSAAFVAGTVAVLITHAFPPPASPCTGPPL